MEDSSTKLHDDAASCCAASLGYMNLELCEDRSDSMVIGTGKYPFVVSNMFVYNIMNVFVFGLASGIFVNTIYLVIRLLSIPSLHSSHHH